MARGRIEVDTPPHPLGMATRDVLAIADPKERYWQAMAEMGRARGLVGDFALIRALAARDHYRQVVADRKAAGLPEHGGQKQAADELEVRQPKLRIMLRDAAAADRELASRAWND